jgi:cell division septation protein DedD
VAAALVFLSLPAADLTSRPLQLEEAYRLELSRDLAAAARLYLAWACDHAGEPSELAGFAGFLRTERSLDSLVDACRDLVPSMPRVPGAWPLLADAAQLFELAGLDEEAAAAAMDAWNRGGPASLLVRAMRLWLAMGNMDAYSAAADRAVAVHGLDPLAATADRLDGRIEESRRSSNAILSAAGDPSARLAAAWNLFEAARTEGATADRRKAAELLARLFPGSPEAALALAADSGAPSRVSEAPSPSLFLAAALSTAVPAARPVADNPPPAAAATVPAAGTFSVQAGAFQVRENADELARELARSGFEAVIREAVSQGKTVYRVFAAAGLDRESADRLLLRLRSAGYAGFVTGD